MTTATATRALPQQVADMQYLLGRLEARGKDMSGTRAKLNDCWATEYFTVEFAADMIKLMLELTEQLDLETRVPDQRTTSPAATVPDGRYAVRNNDGDYAFYRVWNGDRAVLVYQQISDAETRVARTVAQGVLAKIAADPKEAAMAYGRELGVCGVCNRTLTNPESISAGIGPVCASRF